jgi:F0F1-type ATP synthase membrane subunit b/b'
MSAARALKRTKSDFQAKITTLSNTVTANNRKFEIGLQRVTKVAHSFKKASAADRKNLRDQIKGMRQDTNKALISAIQRGQAVAKKVEEQAKANINSAQKALQGEISERLEVMADGVYKGISENRGKIADNYLALKAYCGANAGAIIDYTTKNSGRGLSSVGDFLTTVAALSGLRTKPAEGPGAGGKTVMPLFGGKKISVATSWSKTNGLCNEYTKAMTTVRQRWPLGLGHYLLGKVQSSMQKNGLLTVGKIAGKSGQMVFVNGHAIGLSNKLADFDKLACRAKDYQKFLHGLAKALPKKKKISGKKKYFAPPPEWSGK